MGRAPCCDKANVKKGPWSPEEDRKLKDYIETHGTGGNWIALPQKAGLKRCGKSCRLRWLNYLRPNIKHGEFSDDEDKVICTLFASIGSRWSIMAAQLPGRTDNDIKNYWNTKLKKKMMNSFISSMPHHHHHIRKQPPLHHHHQLIEPLINSSTNYSYPSLSIFNTNFIAPPPHLSSSSTTSSSPPNSSSYLYNNTNNLTIPVPTNHHHQLVQSQDHGGYLINSGVPMETFDDQDVKDISTLVMFGGDQAAASCSTSNSDGSCHYEYGGVHDHNMTNLQSTEDSCKEFGGDYEKEKGYYGNCSSLDSSLEEIKQLISTNNHFTSNIDSNLNFFVDETKEVEKVIYY